MIKHLFSLLLIITSGFVPCKAQFISNLSETSEKENSFGGYKPEDYLLKKGNSTTFFENWFGFQKLAGVNSKTAAYPYITSDNGSLCVSFMTLQAHPVDSSYAYQWYRYVSAASGFMAIEGATNATFRANEAGSYRVMVNDGIHGPVFSDSFWVGKRAEAKFSTLDDKQNVDIHSQANVPLQLKVSFSNSLPPHHFRYIENDVFTNNSFSISTMDNPYILTVTPQQNTKYSLKDVVSTCNSGETEGYYDAGNEIAVIVDESTGFVFETPEKLNVCAGETIKIPYREIGTWSGQKAVQLISYSESENSRYLSSHSYLFKNPMEYTIPEGMNVGEVIRFYVKVNSPYTNSNTVRSPYLLTVTDVGCKASANVISYNGDMGCGSVSLWCLPNYNGNSYQWYKDGQPVEHTYYSSSSIDVTASGNYQVHIKNEQTGYESWSDPNYYVHVRSEKIEILSNSTVLCEEGVPVTLQPSVTGKAYRWEKYDSKTRKFAGLAGEYAKELSTKVSGSYRVVVTTDYCTSISEVAEVTYAPKVKLTNAMNTLQDAEVELGQEVTLRVHVDGIMPFSVWLSDSKGRIVKRFSVNSSPYDIKITPAWSETYTINGSNSCGNVVEHSSLKVRVNPPPSLSLPAISSTSFCKGNLIKIPYSRNGAWNLDEAISVSLVRNNIVLANSTMSFIPSADTLGYYLNTDIPDGNYKLRISFTTEEIYESPYEITVNSCGTFKPYISITSNSTCNSSHDLSVYPKGNYQYMWYLDGKYQPWGASAARASYQGRYVVRVIDIETGYSSNTDPLDLVIDRSDTHPTGVNSELCNNVNVRLSAPKAGDSYQWYYAEMGEAYVEIPGAVNPTFFTTHIGKHMVIVKTGQCEYRQYFKCPVSFDFISATVCQGGAFSVPIDAARTVFTSLKVVDEGTGAEVADLGRILYNSKNEYVVSLPKNVGPGKYRLRADFGGVHAIVSKGILTVSSQVAGPKPVITASPATSIQISIDVSGCNEQVIWDNINSIGDRYYVIIPDETTIYRAYCRSYSGCSSEMAELILEKNCNDAYEPNDSHLQAKEISGDVFTTGNLCFDWGLDEDWFFTYVNGRKYYLLAKKFYTTHHNSMTAVYHIKKEYKNNELSFEFLNPGHVSDLQAITLVLYDENLNELTSNVDNRYTWGLASKVSIRLGNPCDNDKVLNLDFKGNETSVIRAQTIRGSSKVENLAMAGLEASKTILLEPGFETKINSEGVFTAEIKRCD